MYPWPVRRGDTHLPGPQFLRALMQRNTAEGSRASALTPLGWLLAILVPGSMGSFYWELPVGVGGALLAAAGVTTLIYVGSFLYLLINNPDALRSERFTLEKLAIEKGLYGDDLTGFFPANALNGNQAIQHDEPDKQGNQSDE